MERSRRRKRHLSLTLEGLLFITVTMLVGFAAMNTAAQLLYLMFALMCAFLILSALLASSNLRRLVLTREASRLAEAGLPTSVVVRIRNGKRRVKSFSLRVLDRLEGGTTVGAAFFDVVPEDGEEEQVYECLFPRRGVFRLERLELATRYPFGLVQRHFGVNAPREIMVLPGRQELGEKLTAAVQEFGELASARRGRGAGIHNIRNHQPGDSSRDIHWKTSARRGTLMIREYESEEQRRVAVILDNRLDDPTEEELADFERAVLIASSVLHALGETDHPVELLTASGVVSPDVGTAQSIRCRRALATIAILPEAGTKPPRLPEDDGTLEVFVSWGRRAAPAQPGRVVLHTSDPTVLQGPSNAAEQPLGERVPARTMDGAAS